MAWEGCEFRQRKRRSGNKSFPSTEIIHGEDLPAVDTEASSSPSAEGFPTGSSVFPEACLRLLPCRLSGANRLISLKNLWVKLSLN